jgi:hypothetical protein
LGQTLYFFNLTKEKKNEYPAPIRATGNPFTGTRR